MQKGDRGDIKLYIVIVLSLLFVGFVIWFITGGPDRFIVASDANKDSVSEEQDEENKSLIGNFFSFSFDNFPTIPKASFIGSPARSVNKEISGSNEESPFAGEVSLKRGNARSADNPREEYIIIQASRRLGSPINITGWKLTNNRSAHPFLIGERVIQTTNDLVIIPSGVLVPAATGNKIPFSPISLNSGDRAYVISGELRNIKRSEVNIQTSFRENICMGYLTHYADFEPNIRKSCPRGEDITGFNQLPEVCRNYIKRIPRCSIPPKQDEEDFEDLPRVCRTFVETHFNYKGCVTDFGFTEDFLKDNWYVYLDINTIRDLWTRDREIITLYDNQNRIVDQLKY